MFQECSKVISRQEAKALGLKRYYTGVPCKRGHLSERYITAACISCDLERSARVYSSNRKGELANRSRYYKRNKKKVREAQRRYYEENKALFFAKNAEREASKLRATPLWLTAQHKRAILAMYTLSHKKSVDEGELYHVDHIVPLRSKLVCGLHVPWNLRVITAKENLKKRNKLEHNLIQEV